MNMLRGLTVDFGNGLHALRRRRRQVLHVPLAAYAGKPRPAWDRVAPIQRSAIRPSPTDWLDLVAVALFFAWQLLHFTSQAKGVTHSPHPFNRFRDIVH